jgi:hypothetical protein
MDVRERDLDDLFYKYGRIRGIDIKRPSRYENEDGITRSLGTEKNATGTGVRRRKGLAMAPRSIGNGFGKR